MNVGVPPESQSWAQSKGIFAKISFVMAEPTRLELSDARAMRALAHPSRLRLLGLLRTAGPLTATEAAVRIGESSASCSYHLRQLARFGFVEEAGRQGRRRPWRATAQLTAWRDGESEEERVASATLTDAVLSRYFERLGHGVRARLELPEEWREATTFGDYDVHVTAEELRRLTDAVVSAVEPYLRRTERPDLRPAGSRRVTLTGFALPAEP